MERALSKVNGDYVISGVNLVGLVAVAGYTFKTNMDLKERISVLEEEVEKMKSVFQENNKRSNIAFTRLNQKIDAVRVRKPMPSPAHPEEEVIELDNDNGQRDDVSDAIRVLMSTGRR